MILCDTSIWVRYFRTSHEPIVQKFISLLLQEEVCINEFIYVEILQGIKSEEQFRSVKKLLNTIPLFPHTGMRSFEKAIEIYRACNKAKRRLIKTIDSFIAVTALEYNLELFHLDNEFEIIADYFPLKAYNWKT